MSVVGVILMAGTFNLSEIVTSQQGFHWGFLPRWNLIGSPMPQVLGFLLFFICGGGGNQSRAIRSRRSGIRTRRRLSHRIFQLQIRDVFHGGIRQHDHGFLPRDDSVLWRMALAVPANSAVRLDALHSRGGLRPGGSRPDRCMASAISRCLGGSCCRFWASPLCGLGVFCGQPGVIEFIQGPFWFLLKIAVFLFIYVWVRGTLPRFRYDQLMNFGWKLLLPLSILNVVITSLAIVMTQR